ncbi:MAG: hypothetical protein GXO21_01360 [Aquificae bacterium]|nr:hypothetical protein [Aquificota bacterium]
MKYLFNFFLLFLFFNFSKAETLEEKVKRLEEKINQLEKRIQSLEQKNTSQQSLSEQKGFSFSQRKPPLKIENPVVQIQKPEEIISYKVLKKKFEKASIKESLWKRNDQIILKMEFVNKLKKPLYAVKGKVVIFNKEGKKLMETDININKALNFFRGTKIKPNERLKYEVSFVYDKKNPDHKFVKEASLSELIVKFFPREIHFADGTVKYVKYQEENK